MLTMRKPALILVLPFAIFLTETVSFVPVLQDGCTITMATASSCCTSPATEQEEDICSQETGNKEIPADDCTQKPDCTTCPVCYTFIFQPLYEWSPQNFVFKNYYAVLTASYSSFYISSVWKPPNGSLI